MGSRHHLSLVQESTSKTIHFLCKLSEDLGARNKTGATTYELWHRLRGECQSCLGDQCCESPKQSFEELSQFFFQRFRPLKTQMKVERSLLGFALLSHRGPSELLALVFSSLAAEVGLPVSLMHVGPKPILKLLHQGQSYFYRMDKNIQELNKEEVLDLINEEVMDASALPPAVALSDYLMLLKRLALKQRNFLQLYQIQNHLVFQQPFALNHLVDRARTAYILGDIVKAAEDINAYLTYYRPSSESHHKIQRLVQKVKKKRPWSYLSSSSKDLH